MKINPITDAAADQQASSFGLWPRGIYDFEVLEAAEKVSSSGNDMIELNVKLFNQEGKERRVFDWLVNSDGMAYKLRHFAKATGMLPQYEKGELRAADLPGKTGQCQLVIEKGKDNYPDKNKISDYVPVVVGPKSLVSSMPDDEIPF